MITSKINPPVKILCIIFLIAFQTTTAAKQPTINLLDLKQEQLPQPVNVTISKDPVYQTQKVYSGYPLHEIIKNLAIPKNFSTDETVIVFTSADGYKTSIAYNDALREQGYIAFRDMSAPAGQKWFSFKFGKKKITPSPYYLVWPKQELSKWQYPWPFQLVTISLQPAKTFFGSAAPTNSSNRINNGFMLFSKYCIRCHSINLSGGKVGPELNVPKNITEYFNENELPGFILNASAYRAGTKMPTFEGIINEHQLEDIIIYLKHMELEKKQD